MMLQAYSKQLFRDATFYCWGNGIRPGIRMRRGAMSSTKGNRLGIRDTDNMPSTKDLVDLNINVELRLSDRWIIEVTCITQGYNTVIPSTNNLADKHINP